MYAEHLPRPSVKTFLETPSYHHCNVSFLPLDFWTIQYFWALKNKDSAWIILYLLVLEATWRQESCPTLLCDSVSYASALMSHSKEMRVHVLHCDTEGSDIGHLANDITTTTQVKIQFLLLRGPLTLSLSLSLSKASFNLPSSQNTHPFLTMYRQSQEDGFGAHAEWETRVGPFRNAWLARNQIWGKSSRWSTICQ